jgi:hypothetical protein
MKKEDQTLFYRYNWPVPFPVIAICHAFTWNYKRQDREADIIAELADEKVEVLSYVR